MNVTVDAVFDGEHLHPEQPLNIAPNTRVRLTIEAISDAGPKRGKYRLSFLDFAASLNLEGPTDWSENVDRYLYDVQEE